MRPELRSATQQAAEEFGRFWAKYPRKVGKLAAEKKFGAARKRASFDELMAGVDRYIATKPAWAEWCYPKTWLEQGRWLDEPDGQMALFPWRPETPSARYVLPCPHTPACETRRQCCQQQDAERES